MVRKERLELSRLAALVPKTSASTNSAIFACINCGLRSAILTGNHEGGDYTQPSSFCIIFEAGKSGVADGARTHDHRNHNPVLYQLSYSHH